MHMYMYMYMCMCCACAGPFRMAVSSGRGSLTLTGRAVSSRAGAGAPNTTLYGAVLMCDYVRLEPFGTV